MSSLLPVIAASDNFDIKRSKEQLLPFLVAPPDGPEVTIGWIRPSIVELLQSTATHAFNVAPDGLRFLPSLNTFETRSKAVAELCLSWKMADLPLLRDTISGRLWRDELYTVYYNPFRRDPAGNDVAFVMERVCCALFGLVTYGVHMIMYQGDKMWVATRSATKQTWPGYLDNTVAGGIPHSMSPTEALVKECMEEASLPEDFVRAHLKAVGSVTYFFQTKAGWLQPECQYVYDLVIPAGSSIDLYPNPQPLDGEVEKFELLSFKDVIELMHRGRFKANCALVNVDFLIRHGYITPENEPNYLELTTRMHGNWGF